MIARVELQDQDGNETGEIVLASFKTIGPFPGRRHGHPDDWSPADGVTVEEIELLDEDENPLPREKSDAIWKDHEGQIQNAIDREIEK